ncbi:MAG: histidine kinase [Faecalibacterium sp.]
MRKPWINRAGQAKEKSIKNTLMHILIACALAILLLSLIAMFFFYQKSLDKISAVNEQLNQVAVTQIDAVISGTCKEYLDLFINTATSTYLELVANDTATAYEYSVAQLAWEESVSTSIAWMPSYMRSVVVIDMDSTVYSWGRVVPSETQAFLLDLVAQENISQLGDIEYFFVGEEGNEYLIAIRALRNINAFNLSTVGYAATILDFDAIVQSAYLSNIDLGDGIVCAYLDDQLIYVYPQESSTDLIALADIDALSEQYRTDGNSYLVSDATIDGTNIRICTFQNISASQQMLLFAFIGCVIVVALGSIFIVIYSNAHVSRLLRRLEYLTGLINSIFAGGTYHHDIKIDIEPFSHPQVDELTTVAKAYKEVHEKTNTLITENLMRKLLYQEQQFMMLQSQINPHFLYNTLDTIEVLSQDPNKRKTVSDLVASLSGIMRYSLSKDMLSHVSEELQILRQYMIIQRTRFADRLLFSATIVHGCENIELPKMILQPLIENAIQYSVERKGVPSHIRLRIYTYKENLYITVIDTGIGLPDNVLDCLLRRDFAGLPGHGLKNVLIRLENIFGENFTLQVHTKKDQYTAFRICLHNQTQFRDETLTIF